MRSKSGLFALTILFCALTSCKDFANSSFGTTSDSGLAAASPLIFSKTIEQAEADSAEIDSSILNRVHEICHRSIDLFDRTDENFIFSPVSYFLALSYLYSLSDSVSGSFLSSLSISSNNQLLSLCGVLSKLLHSSQILGDYTENYSQTANLVVDGTGDLLSKKDIITNLLYSSYFYGTPAQEDMDDWISFASWGDINKFEYAIPDAGKISFMNGLFFDMPYSVMFDQGSDVSMPFCGEGEYRFMQGPTSTSYAYQSEEYDSLEINLCYCPFKIRFVQPHGVSLSEFLKQRLFSTCFEEEATSTRGTQRVLMPYVCFSSSLDLLPLAKKQGFFADEGEISIGGLGYSPDSIEQSIKLQIDNTGAKAKAVTTLVTIPEEEPELSFCFDSPYAFEIIGRNDLTLFHGEVYRL